MKQAEDNKTIDFLGVPGQRGRKRKYASDAERVAAHRARKGLKKLTVEIDQDLHDALQAYVSRQAADGAALTQSQVIAKLLRTQLLRKR